MTNPTQGLLETQPGCSVADALDPRRPRREASMSALVFQGERMRCVLCGRQVTSDGGKNSDWRALQIDGGHFVYACPAEFPANGASADAFKTAYMAFLAAALRKSTERRPE